MKRKVSKVLFATALLIGIGGGLLHGQGNLGTSFEIPFEFQLNGRAHDAGKYRISYQSGERHVTLQNEKTGDSMLVNFVTRVGAKGQSSLVFDKNGNGRYLKEVYLGHFDGFAFRAGPEDPERQTVVSSNP